MTYCVDDSLIWDEVSNIHASGAMTEGSQVSDLLNFLVREEIEGRGGNVDVYAIATQVLGKGDDFNPVKDASVRVLMFKLRSALDLHYTIAGDTPLRIDLPKRSYRVELSFAEDKPEEPVEEPDTGWRSFQTFPGNAAPSLKRCRAAVAAIAVAGVGLLSYLALPLLKAPEETAWRSYAVNTAKGECAAYLPKVTLDGATGTTDEVLFRTTLETAIATQSWVQLVDDRNDCDDDAPSYRLEYSMAGGLDPMVVTRLIDESSDRPIWGLTVETGESGSDFDIAAARIAYLSSSWNGEIVRDAMQKQWADPKDGKDLRCLLRGFTAYLAGDGLSDQEMKDQFDCLNQAQSRYPDHGIFSWALASNRFEQVKGHLSTGGLTDQEVREEFYDAYLKSRELSGNSQYFTMLQMQLCDFSTMPSVARLINSRQMQVDFPNGDVKAACGRIIDDAFPALRLDPDFLSLAVFTRLLIFGDLQESLDIFDRADEIYGRESKVFALPVWISEYQKGNFQHIKEMALSRSSMELSSYDYMIFMAAAMKMQDRQFAAWAKQGLERRNDVTTLEQAMTLVNNRVVSSLISDIASEGLTFAYDSKG